MECIKEKAYQLMLKLYQKPFILVMRKTLMMLFPFAVLGSIATVINVAFLSKTGFIGNIFYITKWLPHLARIRSMFATFSMMTVKILAVIAAYQATVETTRLYGRKSETAGITGMLAFLIIILQPINHQYGSQTFIQFSINHKITGIQGLFIGILVGYLTGRIFQYFNRQNRSFFEDSFARIYRTWVPVLVILGVAIIINQAIIELYKWQIPDGITAYYQDLSTRKHGLIMTILLGAWSSLMAWFGLSGPYSQNNFNDDSTAVANLTNALKYRNPWHVPYPYTQTTLYHSFGTFGGVGSTLALVIAIIFVARTTRYHRVAQWSLFPVLFNVNQSVLLGIPVLFNPIFLIPFVGTPVVNMLLAALAIHLKIMPPVIYPVPLETPKTLAAFIGTNGNFSVLLIGILILAIDVLIYIPFVKIAEHIRVEMLRKQEHLELQIK